MGVVAERFVVGLPTAAQCQPCVFDSLVAHALLFLRPGGCSTRSQTRQARLLPSTVQRPQACPRLAKHSGHSPDQSEQVSCSGYRP
jgi:hypothetical protein